MKIGYARVSSVDQSLETQLEALGAAGCERIYQEKRSGRTAADRAELGRAMDALREGDVLVVTRLDRLARSVGDLHQLVDRIVGAGAGFTCLQQGGVDTTSATGKLMLAVLGAVAEFENDLRRDRQRDGIERAKAKGKYAGAKRQIDREQAIELFKTVGATEAARRLGIGRASVYRIVRDWEAECDES